MNNLETIINKYNAFVGTAVMLLSGIFGEFWYLFAVFFVLNVFDWLSGWYKARKIKQESSYVGLKGVIKKLWYWVILSVAFLMAFVLSELGENFLSVNLNFLQYFGWFTLASLLVNEARSILENLVVIGVDVPEFLIKGLAITDKLINKTVDLPETEKE